MVHQMTMTPAEALFPRFFEGRRGQDNAITDVAGVRVGHSTLREGGVNTGVTAIVPHGGDVFRSKCVAASHVINGFGKSVGLPQIDELGQLETPILLTNTFGVAACSQALIRRAIRENPAIGRATSTVNPVVGECNDGRLNDIQRLAVTAEDAEIALDRAKGGPVAQGSVGAGTGMVCFGFKGGVGTSSRLLATGEFPVTIGGLVLSNFGKPGALLLPDGRRITPSQKQEEDERGSVIICLATDAPLDARQLRRVCLRAGAGLARLGSFYGHGSGDVVLGFSTANRIDHDSAKMVQPTTRFNENHLDPIFEATAELVHEAVLNAMLFAEDFVGFEGRRSLSLGARLRRDAAGSSA